MVVLPYEDLTDDDIIAAVQAARHPAGDSVAQPESESEDEDDIPTVLKVPTTLKVKDMLLEFRVYCEAREDAEAAFQALSVMERFVSRQSAQHQTSITSFFSSNN